MKRLVLLSLFLFIFAAPAYADSGLVAYYDFDEGNGTVLHDRSGNGNNGTIYGAAWTNGINGSALGFDGVNDYASMPDSTSLGVAQNITVEAWIYPKSIGYINPVLAKGTYAGNFAYFLAIGSNYADDLSFQLGNVGGPGIITGNVSISPNAWYHVVGTRSGNIMRTYVDGQLSYEMNVETTNIRTNPLNLDIGRYVQAGELFNGLIDEVKIYNRALSAEEIKQEYDKYANPVGPIDSDGDGLPDANETAYQLNPYSNDTDSDGINDSTEYNLLSTYLPVFQYTQETYLTEFYPSPVKMFLDYSDLYEFPFNEINQGPISEEQIARYRNGTYYLDFDDGQSYENRFRPDRYKRIYYGLLPDYGYALYMRAVPSTYNGTEYVVLQYWHYYIYNEFINDHEGDWEMIEVILNKTTLDPIYGIYSQHEDSFYRNGGEIKRWDDVQKGERNHPLVYVAQGSHASYFDIGEHELSNSGKHPLLNKFVKFLTDTTSSGGLNLKAIDFNQTIILRDDENQDTQKWLLYGGRWGAKWIRMSGYIKTNPLLFDGPEGPKYHEEKWYRPAEWGMKYLYRDGELIEDYVVAYLEGKALAARDRLGREVAFINRTIINEIPKAEVFSVIGKTIYVLPLDADGINNMATTLMNPAAVEAPSYVYEIEPNSTYKFELYVVNKTEARHIVFYNVSGTSGTKDNVWVKGDKIYMNTTGREKRLNIMLEYMNGTFETHANLTGMTFPGKETLIIKIKDWTGLGRDCKKGHDKEIRAEKQKKCKEIVKIKRRKIQGMRPTRDSEDEGDSQEGEE